MPAIALALGLCNRSLEKCDEFFVLSRLGESVVEVSFIVWCSVEGDLLR